MSVREYIGARYIPLFADPITWDSTLSYEPLTVVKYQGSSYVSRQYVPEGIELSNESYWILWADYNAQLEQYRNEVRQFDGRITTAQQTANGAEAGVTALNGELATEVSARESADTSIRNDFAQDLADEVASLNATISADVDRLETQDEGLSDKIAAINVRNECILMLGDSYAQGVHAQSASENGNNWQDLLIARLGLTDVYKYKGGSAGFIARSTSTSGSSSTVPTNTTYDEILAYAYNYINELGRAGDVRHVLIQGGVNDASQSDTSGLSAAVRNCIQGLHSKFPNAKVHVIYTSCGSTSWQATDKRSFTVPATYKNSCRAASATYNQFTNAPWVYGSSASFDGSHPTNAMQDLMAGFIGQVLISGHAEDLSAIINEDGFVWEITSDHYLQYSPSRMQTPDVSSTAWVSGGVQLAPANARRRFYPANFDVSVPAYGSFVGIRLYIDGSIKWVTNPLNASQLGTTFSLPSILIPIG